MSQLEFDLEALGLQLKPTIAMKHGEQQVFQHSRCGTIIVRSSLDMATGNGLGPCPSCNHPLEPWWQQKITSSGLAGLHLIETRS